MDGCGSNLRYHLVDETDIGKGTTSHNLIITSARTVGVEILGGNSTISQIAGSRGVFGNLSGRRDVIGSDRVTNVEQAVSVIDACNRGGTNFGRCKEGRVVDVCRVILPFVKLTSGSFKVLPHLATVKDSVISFLEHLRGDCTCSDSTDLLTRGPNISKENIFSFLILAERLSLKIDVHGSSNSVGNNKGRRCQVVSSGVRMDTALEVSVAGKDSGSNEIVIDNTVLDSIGDFTGVTNATHATISGC